MSTKITAAVAVVVTAVVVTFLAAFTATPDLVIQLVTGGIAFLVTGLVLLIVLWLPWMRALPESRQKKVVWLVAASTGVAVCCLPFALWLFRP
jgi:hypothetical protein